MAGRVQLLLGSGFEDAWREVARPWFARAAPSAMLAERPWVVLTPTRSLGQALKARLVAERIDLGAVYFWTPGEIREHLGRCLAPAAATATREHLHLLLAATAETDRQPSSRTVSREPGRLMRALDQLAAAGLDTRALDFAPAENLAASLKRALRDAGWTTVQELDWLLAKEPPDGSLASLLVMGFDGAHWELWPLLRAAGGSARETTVVLARPRSKAELLDQAWIGTWEQTFGAADDVAEESVPGPFALLAHRMENPDSLSKPARGKDVDFLVGRNVREQAEAIVAQCLTCLASGTVSRLGILFTGPCPLAREVSAKLIERGIPHFDAFGHPTPPSLTSQKWRAWTALQRSYRLELLLRLLEIDPMILPPESFRETMDRAFGNLLVDEIPVLSAHLVDHGRPEALAAERFLSRFARLPSEGAVRNMLAAVRAAWHDLQWHELLAELDAQARSVAPLSDLHLSRAGFLDWVDSVAPAPAHVRDSDASNPLALVHLLPYAHAEGLPWSHLICADLNEGRWPPPFESSGYLGDERIAELNREALTDGNQGEGHVTAKPRRSLILGPGEKRELCRRQFYNLVEAPTHGLAAACSLESESDSGRVVPASAFLSHLYFTATGETLAESRMEELRQLTARWLARLPPPPVVAPPSQPAPVDAVTTAHTERRRRKPFGAFECAFARARPAQPIELTCKEWEQAVRDPALAWMETCLGVSPSDDMIARDRWPLTCGTWVHGWLAAAICASRGRIEKRRVGKAIAQGVLRAVQQTRRQLARAFTKAGRGEPQWWAARIAHAEWIAQQFAGRLAALTDWPFAATEWTLPRSAEAKVGGEALRLRGRIDLLLAREATGSIPTTCWVVDFKTGNERPLTARTLEKQLALGRGIQLCLYALALAGAGSQEVAVSLLTPGASVAPQLDLSSVEAAARFWSGLFRMQESGIFGMRGEVRAEYGASLEMPLATIPIEADLLEEKWALTHPGLVVEEVDDE